MLTITGMLFDTRMEARHIISHIFFGGGACLLCIS